MKALITSAFCAFAAQAGFAQEVGIQFDQMPIGTKWVTQNVGDEELAEETYLGPEGDTYITDFYRINGGKRRFIFRKTYDAQGRWMSGARNGAATSYAPYSCRYVVGECSHTSQIPHVFEPDNSKFLSSTSAFKNRLENGVFYLGTVLSNGDVREYPFVLGKYNLRVGQDYENALGQKRGFKLVELVEP